MSIQQLLTTKQELLHSIDQHEAYLKEKKGYQILLRQTEGFSLPFVEAIGIGILTIWVSSLGLLPPLFLIFSEPLFAFGLASILLIPINLILSHWIKKNKQHALQQGNLVEMASTFSKGPCFPSFIIEPIPNCLSISETVFSIIFSLSIRNLLIHFIIN